MNQHRFTLEQINTFSLEEFVRTFGGVFEHSPWIAEATWPKRPFTRLENLHDALCETVRVSAENEKLSLIRAHPDLVGRAALAGTLTADSTKEQASAGLNH